MAKNLGTRSIAALALAVGLLGCSKEPDVTPNAVATGKTSNQDIEANYPFDWETALTMPMSASATTQVYVPWRSQGGVPLDPGIVNDYKRSDGWELVYNTFSPDNFPRNGVRGSIASQANQNAGGLYFALYNRYRGLLRYYVYIPPGLYGSSTQLAHGLQIYSGGSSSKMLNFEGTDVVDVGSNNQGFTKTNKDGVSTAGGWYAMQYQLAYDPFFAGTTYPNPGFRWDIHSINVTQIESNGTEIGSIKGTITTPTPDFNWAGTIVNSTFAAIEIFSTGGLLGTSELAKAVGSGVGGSTKGLLDGLFGGNSDGGPKSVDLKVNSTIKTTGTATSMQSYQANALVFPGQTPGPNGVAPLINYSLGLFNLSGKPLVKIEAYEPFPTSFDEPSSASYYYTVDETAVRGLIQQNPNVFNSTPTGATLRDFKVEILVPDVPTDAGYYPGGTKEVIGTHTVYVGSPDINVSYSGYGGAAPPDYGPWVRISFNVVPNGTAPSVFVVKTFKADVNIIRTR